MTQQQRKQQTYVVVGAGLAATKAAQTLREEGFTGRREAIRGGGRVVVVGAGWIGLETAAAARQYGCEVTVIEPQPTPLQAALGPGAGASVIGGFFAQVRSSPGGFPAGAMTLVTRGDLAARAFSAFWITDGRVVAGMHVNQWDEGIAPVQDLIRCGVPVDRHRLSDPAVPLRDSVECNVG
ncbi:MAG: FAD-dependent oxidoreductase [Pseudonocardiaceae bacterium]